MHVCPTSQLSAPGRGELLLIALALAFGWLGAASLALQRNDALSLIAMGVLSTAAISAHVWLDRVAKGRDLFLLPVVTLLTAFGLLAIARTAPNFVPRQLPSLGVATVAMLAVATSRDRLRWLWRFKYTWLLAAFLLLFVTLLFGVNPSGFGARLWLSFAGLFVQPSEILRLLVIAFLAAYFAERLENSQFSILNSQFSLQSLAPTILMWLVALALLVSQQDLGAATMLLLTFAFMLYLATGRARLPLVLLGALLVAGVIGYFVSERVAQRLNIWLNPWADPRGSSFQVVQSLIALASGGVFGQGINQGAPGYVPAVHTDFPFVMIGEELGLVGALAVIAAYAVLIGRTWRIALAATTPYSLLLAGGIAAAITVQVFAIIGGNLSLLPLTGVTLPFISYGGTSLVVSYFMVGLLVRLSADAAQQRSGPANSRPVRHLAAISTPKRPALRAMRLSLAMMGVLALATGYWGIARSAELVTRGDNPRRVDAELAIARGPIYDRNGMVLAESLVRAVNNGLPRYARVYSHSELAPVVGYYSQRYGVGGMESYADLTLRGQRTPWEALLHRPQVGNPITLTLDSTLQRRIVAALRATQPNTITRGAAVVLNWRAGEVLALASTPTFDLNALDDAWEALRQDPNAPLVNRATQGLYQPGMLLQWFLKIKAPRDKSQEENASDSQSWLLALDSLHLHERVPFELPNEAVPLPVSATYSETIGQGALRVTPLRVATTAASLAAGRAVTPTLLWNGESQVPAVDQLQPLASHSPFVTFAQIGPDQYVGWFVHIGDERVTVIALEQQTPDEAALQRVAEAARL